MVLKTVYGFLDWLLGPILALDPNPATPLITIFIISTLVALISSVAQKLLVDQDELTRNREEMNQFQKEMREAQQNGGPKEIQRLQKQQEEFMQKQSKMMMSSFKPMIVTFVPILLVFYWMSQQPIISKTVLVLPQIVYYVFLIPVWHLIYSAPANAPAFAVGWLGWYIICQFAMSQVIRKFMGFSSTFQ